LYVARGAEGEPRELLNVNRLDSSGQLALAWYEPSRDGRYVAFGTYRAGDENTSCRVLEARTGEWLDGGASIRSIGSTTSSISSSADSRMQRTLTPAK
jgi:hypothetical protein